MQINKGYNVNMTNKWIEKHMETPRISFCFSCFTLQILQVFVLFNIVSSCSSMNYTWQLESLFEDIANELLKRRSEMDAVKESLKARWGCPLTESRMATVGRKICNACCEVMYWLIDRDDCTRFKSCRETRKASWFLIVCAFLHYCGHFLG